MCYLKTEAHVTPIQVQRMIMITKNWRKPADLSFASNSDATYATLTRGWLMSKRYTINPVPKNHRSTTTTTRHQTVPQFRNRTQWGRNQTRPEWNVFFSLLQLPFQLSTPIILFIKYILPQFIHIIHLDM